MQEQDNLLPADFDGVFRFTNWTDRDFAAKWNSVEYVFPANKTSPMIIMGESPENIQQIRKKFAKELAEREFYLSDTFKARNDVKVGENPALYTSSELEPLIARALIPLPTATATARVIKEDKEKAFHKDEKGSPRTRVLGKEESLVNGPVITD